MDPNATLAHLRKLVADFSHREDSTHPQRELMDAVVDLDEWLSRGGFLPDAWRGETYSRAEIVNGTGFKHGLRFRAVGVK